MRLRGDHKIRNRDHRLVIMPTALFVFHLHIVEPEWLVDQFFRLITLERTEFPLSPIGLTMENNSRPIRSGRYRESQPNGTQVVPVNLRRH